MKLFRRYEQVAKAFGFRLGRFSSGLKTRNEWIAQRGHAAELLVTAEARRYFEIGYQEVRHQLTEDEFRVICRHMAIHYAMTNKGPDLDFRGLQDLPNWEALRDLPEDLPTPKPTPGRGKGKTTALLFGLFGKEIKAMIWEGVSDGEIAKAVNKMASEHANPDIRELSLSRYTIMRWRKREFDIFKLG